MVPGPRLLLTWAAALLLLGCPAEDLGVELPKGGPQSVSAEDLQRDAWAIQKAGRPGDAAGHVAKRLAQMRLLPGFGSTWVGADPGTAVVCGRKDGQGAPGALIVAEGDPASTDGQVVWAALISLGKATDLPTPPARGLWLCATPDAAATAALLAAPPTPLAGVDVMVLGALSGPSLDAAPAVRGSVPVTALAAAEPGVGALGEVDMRRVVGHVVAVHGRLPL
ncbi:MAG: hypothetical protein H6742_02730 [Alphaproteobacteria bacterium]|nr:hypothetical protein [Alphaproteobacteria bacterium]